MNKSNGGYLFTGISAFFTVVQTNEVFSFISLGLTCLSLLINIVYTLLKWYKDAKSDGKITADELVDAIDKAREEVAKATETIEKEKDKI